MDVFIAPHRCSQATFIFSSKTSSEARANALYHPTALLITLTDHFAPADSPSLFVPGSPSLFPSLPGITLNDFHIHIDIPSNTLADQLLDGFTSNAHFLYPTYVTTVMSYPRPCHYQQLHHF